MQRLIDELTGTLRVFAAQRDTFTLVVTAGSLERAAVAAALRTLDAAAPDLVFTWGHDFVTAGVWTDVAYASLAAQHAALASEGLPLPTLPPPRGRGDPVDHGRSLLAYTRDLRPDPEGTVVLWALVPARVASPVGYAGFLAALAPGDGPAPWCRGLRLVACDDAAAPALAALPKAAHCAPDLGPTALTGALAADADDEALPLSARMAALLVLAGVDLAWGRLADAAAQYALLADYHGAMGDAASHAVAQAGLAEGSLRCGRHAEARSHREAALVLAVEARAWPLALSVAEGIAETALADGDTAEATEMWTAAAELATALGLRDVAARCLWAGGAR